MNPEYKFTKIFPDILPAHTTFMPDLETTSSSFKDIQTTSFQDQGPLLCILKSYQRKHNIFHPCMCRYFMLSFQIHY